jgi:hypothetical protein
MSGACLKSAALRICKFLGAGKRVSIAYVVGATHFPWVGAAIETRLAITIKTQPSAIHALSRMPSAHGGGYCRRGTFV